MTNMGTLSRSACPIAVAEELCLTQSAVSRQVKKLEAFLGCTLFERVKQRVILTAVGSTYAQEIRELLDSA
jgi:LysR family transcriptional regulator, glycine cleavage system transcriptional activator